MELTGKLVEKLSFTRTAALHMPVQRIKDEWRGTERVCRFVGNCKSCGKPTWGFDDGGDDPRGALGDYASSPVTDATETVEIPCCTICANVYETYKPLEDMAERKADRLAEKKRQESE